MPSEEEDMKDMVGGCCVCSDENGSPINPLVYCDGRGCSVAVHQACYGIEAVPSGPWFCRKCELSAEKGARVKCDLCPSRDGALKRTDQNGWAHVVCALFIPEVRFGNVTTMEPIQTTLIPTDRFGKSCYICESNNRGSKANAGACMQCNKPGCKQYFHVTCAQIQGLLCEEAGSMDNVKYCGYCQYHYGKLKTSKNMKIIPPFRPVPSSSGNADSPGSSPEKTVNKPPSMNEDKSYACGTGSGISRHSTPTSTGDYIPAKKTGSSNSISPDIDSSMNGKNSKHSKKSSSGNGGHHSSSKSDNNGSSSKSGSITPKIAQPVLGSANFQASFSSKALDGSHGRERDGDDKAESSSSIHGSSKKSNETRDDSLTIKLERVDNPLSKSSSGRKDVTSTLHFKEVVSPALGSGGSSSKYDHSSSSALVAGIDLGSSSGHSSSSSSKHSDKPAPPDIKPHVTLTPIPMMGGNVQTTTINLGQRSDREEREEKEGRNKSPASSSSLSYHSNSFHQKPNKVHQTQTTPETSEFTSSKTTTKPVDMASPNDHSLDRSVPPAKRARGGSRDDEKERKTPTKGRGGSRRGSSNSSGYGSRREPVEDPGNDEHGDVGSSSRGGRSSGPTRKTAVSRPSGLERPEDPPAPTLSQIRTQMEGRDSTLGGVIPTHMFGNALNPNSSMAQRMVDTLSLEMEAVAAATSITETVSSTPLTGIQFPGKSSFPVSSVNGTSGSNSTATNSSGAAPPQTLEQLLERQWEQGSQFLMEQAQHLDIAQLLSCLNQLKQDNRALEEHVQSLIQRRDQLIAINARLSIPLGNSNALGPLGPTIQNSVNGSSQNGHGTPPPTLTPQGLPSHVNLPKSLHVNSSTPSPQNQHELMMANQRHGPRDERMYHSELQVTRPEVNMTHTNPQQSHSRQNVSSYGYGNMGHHSMGGSHHSHGHGRDGGR